MKRLLLGPAGCGKTHRILDEFQAHLAESGPLADDSFFVLPSAEHTDRIITQLLQRGIKGFFFRRVTTLSNLTSRIFASGEECFVSSSARFLILKEIFESRPWGYFQTLQNTPGFLNLMTGFISELKESFIGPEEFRARMNGLKTLEPELAVKYESLAGIYEAYEEALGLRGLRDRQDLLRFSRLRENSASGRPRFKKIWLDGFFDFSNLQQEYLRELAGLTEEMTVTLTQDENGRRPELFEAIRPTAEMLTKLGFESQWMKPDSRRAKSPALQYAERFLFFDGKKPKPPEPAQALRVFEAVGIQGEVEMIAREILRLYRNGEHRFSDFAVLLRQVGAYEPVIRSVFSRYEIPVEIHERERLKLAPMIETLRALLLIFLEGWKREPLMNFLKSSYVSRFGENVPKSYEWISEFENAAHQEGVLSGLENWFRDWSGQGKLSALWNQKKNQNLDALIQLEVSLKASKTPLEMERLLMAALKRTFGVLKAEDSFEESVRRDAASGARLEALFEEIRSQAEMQRRETVGFQEFAEHLLRLLEIDLYSLHERSANRVQVYDISLARQKEYRVVFAAGLLEKSFPIHVKEDPVLSDWERQLFNRDAPHRLSESLPRQHLERYLFYLTVTRPSEQLILSCPRLDLEGKESLPSFYLDETAGLFEDKMIRKKQDLSRPYPLLEDAVSERELEAGVMGELWNPHPVEKNDFLLYLSAQMLTRAETRSRFRRAFEDIKAEILDPEILAGGYFKSERTSATALEDFAKCPFQYFAKRVLKLKDPREERNVMQKGIIRHEVLEHFFKFRLKRGGKISPAEIRKFVDEALKEALAKHPLLIERKYQKELYETEIKEMLLGFLDAELESLQANPLQPLYMEYAFGTRGNPDAPALEFDDHGRRFSVTGKIDRVDVDPSAGTALVVDYKTSAAWSWAQAENGTSLQLPIYLLAVEKYLKLKTAGAHLRSLKTGKSSGFYHAQNAAPYAALSKRSAVSGEEFQALLDSSIDYLKRFTREMSQGRIAVQPRDRKACDYCDYAAVCRIQKWRLPLIAEEIRQADEKQIAESAGVRGKSES